MNEKGEALLEAVLIAPIILMIGLFATEFGYVALNRAQLSERVRSTINAELLNLESTASLEDDHTLESSIKRSLRTLPNLDHSNTIEVEVNFLKANDKIARSLPFLTLDKSTIDQYPPKEIEVRVKIQGKGLLNSQIELPVLIDVVRYRLRGGE